jgi:serine/threonine protein kinase
MAMEIAQGMAYLHARRVAHLDLKLGNIMVRRCLR